MFAMSLLYAFSTSGLDLLSQLGHAGGNGQEGARSASDTEERTHPYGHSGGSSARRLLCCYSARRAVSEILFVR